jgi:predicted nucleic acid-binding protein
VRVFLDTNVLVSALGTRGICADLLQAVVLDHTLVWSDGVRSELEQALRRSFRLPSLMLTGYLEFLANVAETAPEAAPLPLAVPDPSDAPILASAAGARSDLFVTGAKALLELARIGTMEIVSVRATWERFSART